jgi:hypothetical protein
MAAMLEHLVASLVVAEKAEAGDCEDSRLSPKANSDSRMPRSLHLFLPILPGRLADYYGDPSWLACGSFTACVESTENN